MATGNPNIDSVFDSITHNIERIIDVVEKNGRINSPTSDYFPLDEDGSVTEKDFEELTRHEIELVRNSLLTPLRQKMNSINEELGKKYNTLSTITNTSSREYKSLQKQINNLEEQANSLTEEANNLNDDTAVENAYNTRVKFYSDAQIKKRWDKASQETKNRYGSFENFSKVEKFKGEFNKRKAKRIEASNMIAGSGLGRTGFGKFMQSAIGIAQTRDSTKLFNMNLQNGGAEDISKGLFGDGRAARGAASALKGVGNAAEKLGAPLEILGLLASGFLAILKLFGKVIAAEADYVADEAEIQADIIKSQFDYQEQTLDANTDRAISILNAQGNLKSKEMDVQGENMLGALKIVTQQYAKAHEIAASHMFDGINEAVYNAANSSLEAAADIRKYQAQKAAREKSLSAQRATTAKEIQAAKDVAAARNVVALTNYEAINAQKLQEKIFLDEKHWIVKDKAKNVGDQLASLGAETFGNIYNGSNSVLNKSGLSTKGYRSKKLADTITSLNYSSTIALDTAEALDADQGARAANQNLAITDYTRGIALESQKTQLNAGLMVSAAQVQQQLAEQAASIEAQRAEILADAALRIKKAWLELAKNVEKYLGEHDKKSNDAGIGLGFTDKQDLFDYKKAMLYVVRDVASEFGYEIEEVLQANTQFAETTGRNKVIAKEDVGKVLAMGYSLNDVGLATEVASAFEIYNKSVGDSMEMLFDAMQKVNRHGLNFRAYTKNILSNIQLAQKYNFAEGLKGFMRMTEWAMNVRLNINELGSAIDKVQEGGLEGVISQSAGLGVLGGQAAINSDPLAMFYEVWNDAEAYAHRINRMVKDFGTINMETGETNFNVAESMHITRMANLMGLSAETYFNQVRARNKAKAVSEHLKKNPQIGQNWSDDFKQNVINRATYNKQLGQWQVKVKTLVKDKYGDEKIDFVDKNIDELNPEEAQDFIMPEDHKGRMLEYMQEIVSIVDKVKSAEIKVKADLAASTYEEYIQQMDERTAAAHKLYEEKRSEYIEHANEGIEQATQQFNNFIESWKKGNTEIDNEVTAIGNISNNLGEHLDALQKAALATVNSLNTLLNLSVKEEEPPTGESKSTPPPEPTYKEGDVVYSGRTTYDVSSTNVIDEDIYTQLVNETALKDLESKGGVTLYGHRGNTGSGTQSWEYRLTQKGADELNAAIAQDSFIPAQGRPIITYAQNVVPLGSGDRNSQATFIRTDPNDSAIYARPGDQVDKEFTEVSAQVNSIGENIGLWGASPNRRSRIDRSPNTLHNATIVLTGVIDLECEDSSFDIAQYLEENPIAMRGLTVESSKEMLKTANGGKSPSFAITGYAT